MMFRLFAALTLAFPLSALATQISVMTFDNIGYVNNIPYTEDGITATGGVLYSRSQESVHMGRYDEFWPSSLDFVMDSLFVPVSVDLLPGGSSFCSAGPYTALYGASNLTPGCENSHWDDEIPYMWVSGYRNGQLVDSIGVYSPVGSPWQTVFLSDFGAIDLLRVQSKNYFDLGLTGACIREPCGHFNLDNVRLESVPEPATLSLLVAGLAGMLTRRRRRSTPT